jgi:hypothetical protein
MDILELVKAASYVIDSIHYDTLDRFITLLHFGEREKGIKAVIK